MPVIFTGYFHNHLFEPAAVGNRAVEVPYSNFRNAQLLQGSLRQGEWPALFPGPA